MLPKQLLELFEKYTADDCSTFITKIDSSPDEILVDFYINTYDVDDNGPIIQKWTIETTGHKKNRFLVGPDSSIKIKTDHPLLWEFTDTQCELYFKGKIKNHQNLFYDLYTAHKTLFDNYEPFNNLLGEQQTDLRPFRYTNGLLAKGSKKLMEKYAYCLKQNGLDYSIIGERPSTYSNNDQHESINQTLKILFLGDSYIIAQNFAFTRRD